MHHRRPPPRLTQRIRGVLTRVPRSGPRQRGGRLALSALFSTVLTALVLAAPVSGATGAPGATPFVARESVTATGVARTTSGDSPVVMGRDGPPASSSTSSQPGTAPAETSTSATDAGAPSAEQPTTKAAPAETATAAGTAAAESSTPPVVVAPPVIAPVQSAAPVQAAAPAQAAAPVQAAAAVPAGVGAEGQVLSLVNAERAAAGCGALVADTGLASVARAHSADMRDRDFFSHVNPDGLDPFDRAERAGLDARAENIARGQESAADVMDAWMSSSGHRASILDCSLTRLGVGMVEGDDGPWWTQLFA